MFEVPFEGFVLSHFNVFIDVKEEPTVTFTQNSETRLFMDMFSPAWAEMSSGAE